MTNFQNQFPQLFLRLAISFTMLSAVADRFGFWGDNSSWGNWGNFVIYTKKLTHFLPESFGAFSAIIATTLELIFSLMLIFGFKTKLAAYGTSILLLIFALSMTISLGTKAPLDYSVWVVCAASLLLAIQDQFSWSVDEFLKNK